MSTATMPLGGSAPASTTRIRPAILRAEWTKFRTLRSSWLTMGISVVGAVALGAIAAASNLRARDTMTPAEQAAFDPTSTSLIGVLFGALVLGALGVRSITAEYASGMIRTTAAAIPRRGHVLWAKAAVAGAAALGAGLVSNVGGFTAGQAILRTEGIQASLGDRDSLTAIFAGALAVSSFAVIGVGLGAVVRRASVANILVALVVVGGQLVGSAMPTTAQRYLPFSLIEASVTTVQPGDLLAPLVAVALLASYAAVILLVATSLMARRDV